MTGWPRRLGRVAMPAPLLLEAALELVRVPPAGNVMHRVLASGSDIGGIVGLDLPLMVLLYRSISID